MRPLALLVTLSLLATGCTTQSDVDNGKVQVTTTIAQIADVVRNVGGEPVEVTALMGPSVDPHLYKASQGDVAQLTNSDLILYNGLMLEGRLVDVLIKVARGGKPTLAVAEAVDESLLREPPEYEGLYDPHIWMNVSLWAQSVPLIVEQLSQIAPQHAETFAANGEAYGNELDELHQWVQEQIAAIPEQQRVLITAHDAFGYFGEAYDIDVMGLQGISTASEYGLRDLERLVDIIVERGVKAVFIESSVPPRPIEALVEGCRAEGHEIEIGGELFSDAMGKTGTPEGTYIGMVKHNVNTIVEALR